MGSATLRRQVRPLPPIFATNQERDGHGENSESSLYPKKDGMYRPSAKLLVCLSVCVSVVYTSGVDLRSPNESVCLFACP